MKKSVHDVLGHLLNWKDRGTLTESERRRVGECWYATLPSKHPGEKEEKAALAVLRVARRAMRTREENTKPNRQPWKAPLALARWIDEALGDG